MSVFRCVECEQHYCVTCDGGEDSCPTCRTGPRCHDCAFDHDQDEHRQEPEPEDEQTKADWGFE